MVDEDSYAFQRARVAKVCTELAPGKLVEFDETSTWIKFKITDPVTRIRVTGGAWYRVTGGAEQIRASGKNECQNPEATLRRR